MEDIAKIKARLEEILEEIKIINIEDEKDFKDKNIEFVNLYKAYEKYDKNNKYEMVMEYGHIVKRKYKDLDIKKMHLSPG